VPPIVVARGRPNAAAARRTHVCFAKFVEVVVDHLVDLGSVSALSEMSPKSAVFFP
jgi:hypothetical protein